MYILGLNIAYHETAAALLADGILVAAVEEERLSGRKHGKSVRVDNIVSGLPWRAMRAVLEMTGVDWKDIDVIACSLDPQLRKLHACLGTEGPQRSFGHPEGEALFQKELHRAAWVLSSRCEAAFHFVPHHFAHAWYAFALAEFEDAAWLVMDGIGEGASTSWGTITGRRFLRMEQQTLFPHSVGMAWEKMARLLGLTSYDACKVMALASHVKSPAEASPSLSSWLHVENGQVHVDQSLFWLEFPNRKKELRRLLAETSPEQMAARLQRETEKALVQLSEHIREATRQPFLAWGGGVALNCVANQTLAESGIWSSLHAGSASHDAGTAAGAAWHVWAQHYKQRIPLQNPRLALFSGVPPFAKGEDVAQPPQEWQCKGIATPEMTANLLLEGNIVGHVSGRHEFGPRALGARSLLARADDPATLDKMQFHKKRLAFEPYAVSVLADEAERFFDIPKPGYSLTHAMLMTVRPKPCWKERLKHLLPERGIIRIQVVERTHHRAFAELLEEMGKRTGLPMLVNTSFNQRGRPMPGTLERIWEEANALRLGWLVIEDRLFEHRPSIAHGKKEQNAVEATNE